MISTIVITFNRLKLNRYFIDSYHETVPRQAGELIVVDNNSTDGTREYLERERAAGRIDKLILNDENYYLGKAFNQGLKIVNPKTRWVGKFDNDGYFEKGWYQNFLAVADCSGADVVVVATTDKKRKGHVREAHGISWLSFPDDVGGSYYIRYDFVKRHRIRLMEQWWSRNFSGPNPSFFRMARARRAKIVRILPPWVTRRYEKYSDPEYKEYYESTFEQRDLLDRLKQYQDIEKENGQGPWNE